MRTRASALFAAMLLAACWAIPAGAQERGHGPEGGRMGGPEMGGPRMEGPGMRDRGGPPAFGPRASDRRAAPPGVVHHEMRHPPREAEWRGGNWRHGWHDGRQGWWWTVGGLWFFYDQPVYPYPAYAYAPPPPVGPPAPYYYCYNPPGYYPNVPACPGGWYTAPAP